MTNGFELWSLPWQRLLKDLARKAGAGEAVVGRGSAAVIATETANGLGSAICARSWLSRARQRMETPALP